MQQPHDPPFVHPAGESGPSPRTASQGRGMSRFSIVHATQKSVAGRSRVHFSTLVSGRVAGLEVVEMPRAQPAGSIIAAQQPEQVGSAAHQQRQDTAGTNATRRCEPAGRRGWMASHRRRPPRRQSRASGLLDHPLEAVGGIQPVQSETVPLAAADFQHDGHRLV